MYRGLYFKIILILVIFTLIVMSVVGAVLISSVLGYYNDQFAACMTQNFGEDAQLRQYLVAAMTDADGDFAAKQKSILASYASRLGIDDYRNYYILDADGNFLNGSDTAGGEALAETPNLVAAMNGQLGDANTAGSDYADYALPLTVGDASCIIYLRDTQDELHEINWMLFSIILQALFIAYDEIDVLLYFRDTVPKPQFDEAEYQLLRLCDVHNVPVATNIATAEVLICAVERGDLNWREFVNPRSEYNRRKKAQL